MPEKEAEEQIAKFSKYASQKLEHRWTRAIIAPNINAVRRRAGQRQKAVYNGISAITPKKADPKYRYSFGIPSESSTAEHKTARKDEITDIILR